MASRLLSIIRSYKPSDGQSRGSNKTSLKTTPSPPVTSLDSLRSSPFQQSQQLMTLQQQQQHRNNIKYRTVVSHQCSHRWPPPPLRYYHLRFHLIPISCAHYSNGFPIFDKHMWQCAYLVLWWCIIIIHSEIASLKHAISTVATVTALSLSSVNPKFSSK
jgi:hypothetical protein